MRKALAILSCLGCPLAVQACDTALLLAVDVSNSVDTGEYRLQVDGLADALQDGEVIEAMLRGQVAIAVMQWSGVDRQLVTTDWRQVRVAGDALALSAEVRATPRASTLSGTAPAEAVYFALQMFAAAPDCGRQVIDVSGDGTPNAGSQTELARNLAETQGVTINGIAIESLGQSITSFYRNALTTRDGFVVTARTHRDYPEAIRNKILRELAQVIG